jgi:hypothetical protein
MLTESEKRWLGRREQWLFHSCQWCEHLNVNKEGIRTPCSIYLYGCPRVDMDGNDDDIAFEARVAAKLAITGDYWDFEDMPCRGEHQFMWRNCKLRKNHWDCADCYIKAARLQVEEEMNGYNTM